MKVLLGANASELRGGGVATYVRRIAAGVERLGATVEVLWGKPNPAWMPGPAGTGRYAYALQSAATSGRYDVVAAQGGDGALLSPRGPGRVVTSHGDDRMAWQARRRYAPLPVRQRFVTPLGTLPLYRAAIRRADVVIALHDSEARKFRGERWQGTDTVHVIPNGCGPVSFDASPVRGRIAFVGDWIPRKGSLIIPEIFRLVRSANPGVLLTLVGPDPAVLANFHPDDRVRVRALGFVERSETERVLRSSDLLLMPSFFEGMPLAVLEAVSFGVPTVGFDDPGTVAAAGKSGSLVAVGDVNGCAKAIVRVIRDRALRRRLSEEALARGQQLTWDATAARTLAAYEQAARLSRNRL